MPCSTKVLKKKYGDNYQLKVELIQVGKTFIVKTTSKINNKIYKRKYFKFKKANTYFNHVYDTF